MYYCISVTLTSTYILASASGIIIRGLHPIPILYPKLLPLGTFHHRPHFHLCDHQNPVSPFSVTKVSVACVKPGSDSQKK